jgi:hypothetical protein
MKNVRLAWMALLLMGWACSPKAPEETTEEIVAPVVLPDNSLSEERKSLRLDASF